eukprot:g1469.t1
MSAHDDDDDEDDDECDDIYDDRKDSAARKTKRVSWRRVCGCCLCMLVTFYTLFTAFLVIKAIARTASGSTVAPIHQSGALGPSGADDERYGIILITEWVEFATFAYGPYRNLAGDYHVSFFNGLQFRMRITGSGRVTRSRHAKYVFSGAASLQPATERCRRHSNYSAAATAAAGGNRGALPAFAFSLFHNSGGDTVEECILPNTDPQLQLQLKRFSSQCRGADGLCCDGYAMRVDNTHAHTSNARHDDDEHSAAFARELQRELIRVTNVSASNALNVSTAQLLKRLPQMRVRAAASVHQASARSEIGHHPFRILPNDATDAEALVASSLAKARKRRQQELLTEVARATAKLSTTTSTAAVTMIHASEPAVDDSDAVMAYRRWHAALLHGALDQGNSGNQLPGVEVHTIPLPINSDGAGRTTTMMPVTSENAADQSLSTLLNTLDGRGDRDGRLSKSELNDWLDQLAGNRSSALVHRVSPFFERADRNGDGFVGPLEFEASASSSHFGLAVLLRRIAATVARTELRV